MNADGTGYHRMERLKSALGFGVSTTRGFRKDRGAARGNEGRKRCLYPVFRIWFLICIPCMAQNYDLLLKNGHVIDPKNNLDAVADVAIRQGKVAAVGPNLDAAGAAKTIDVSGLYVTPGIVDIHTHLFHTTGLRDAWAGDNSIAPDGFSFRTGVTTMVDAGSSGWRNFETFRHTVIDRVQTRVFALINIAGLGMMTDCRRAGERAISSRRKWRGWRASMPTWWWE